MYLNHQHIVSILYTVAYNKIHINIRAQTLKFNVRLDHGNTDADTRVTA